MEGKIVKIIFLLKDLSADQTDNVCLSNLINRIFYVHAIKRWR